MNQSIQTTITSTHLRNKRSGVLMLNIVFECYKCFPQQENCSRSSCPYISIKNQKSIFF